MNILIIEDEIHTAKDLIRTLHQINDTVEVVRHTSSVRESMDYLMQSPNLDLIFSDIKLGDGHCFEIFDAIDVDVPIIFCTAFDEFALEAFRTNGIDYVLKPFKKETIEKALGKYHRLTQSKNQSLPNLQSMIDLMMNRNAVEKKSLLVHRGDKIIPVKVDDILLFYVEDKYSFAHTIDDKRYLLSQSLEELSHLFPSKFYRVNRQFVVNRKAIKEVVQHANRKLKVVLHQNLKHEILVGKLKRSSFLDWLGNGV